jgi:hypothetical protein
MTFPQEKLGKTNRSHPFVISILELFVKKVFRNSNSLPPSFVKPARNCKPMADGIFEGVPNLHLTMQIF